MSSVKQICGRMPKCVDFQCIRQLHRAARLHLTFDFACRCAFHLRSELQ